MLRICDPHIHLWDLSTGLYPWLEKPSTSFIGDNTQIARDYLLPEFLSETSNEIEVLSAVHIEVFPTDPLKEVAQLQAVADGAPIPLGIVGNADLTRSDVGEQLDAMSEKKMFRGIRQVVNLHDDPELTYVQQDYLSDPDFARGFGELGRRSLSFDLQLYPNQAEAAARIAMDNPDTMIILNHVGLWVDRNADGWRAWKSALGILSRRPNIRVKISGLGMFDRLWTQESIRPLIYETLEAFGTDRAMFASNFPVDKLFGSYTDLWQAFSNSVSDLTW